MDGSHGNVGGNHANTHLPEIVGTARGYEVTGNTTQLAIVANFFNILTAGENKTWDPYVKSAFKCGGFWDRIPLQRTTFALAAQ